jgi:hypothetical protein
LELTITFRAKIRRRKITTKKLLPIKSPINTGSIPEDNVVELK